MNTLQRLAGTRHSSYAFDSFIISKEQPKYNQISKSYQSISESRTYQSIKMNLFKKIADVWTEMGKYGTNVDGKVEVLATGHPSNPETSRDHWPTNM